MLLDEACVASTYGPHALQTAQANLFGASVLGPNEIYTKLKGYKSRLLQKYPGGKL